MLLTDIIKRTFVKASDKRIAAFIAPFAVSTSAFLGFTIMLSGANGTETSHMPKLNAAVHQKGYQYRQEFYLDAYKILNAAAFSPESSLQSLVREKNLSELPKPPFKNAEWSISHGKIVRLSGVPSNFCGWVNMGAERKDHWINQPGAQCYMANNRWVVSYQDSAFGKSDLRTSLLEVKTESSYGVKRVVISLKEDAPLCKIDDHAPTNFQFTSIDESQSFCLTRFYFENANKELGRFYREDEASFDFELGGKKHHVEIDL